MKKSLLGAYMFVMASGVIVMIILSMIYTPVQTYKNKLMAREYEYYRQLEQVSRISQTKKEETFALGALGCESAGNVSIPVGGLGRDDVPKINDAVRLNYDDNGASIYTTRNDDGTVIQYYLSQLSSECWDLLSLKDSEAVWNKDNTFLRIAVAEKTLGGKNMVSYDTLSGVVLGEEFQYAQTEGSAPPPPPPSGSFGTTQPPPPPPPPPSGSFGTTQPPPGGSYPSSGSTYGTQPPPPPPGGTYPSSQSGSYGTQPPPGGSYPSSGSTYGTQPPQGSYTTSPSGGYQGQPGGYPGSGSQCQQGQFWCEKTKSCAPQGSSCGEFNTYPTGENKYNNKQYPQQGGDTQSQRQGYEQGNSGFGPEGSQDHGYGSQKQEGYGASESEEEMNKQEEQMQKQQLDMMKRNAKRMEQEVSRGFKQLRPALKQLKQRCGLELPEVNAAIEAVGPYIEKIKNASSSDEVEDAMLGVQEALENASAAGEKIPEYFRLCDANKEISRQSKRFFGEANSIIKRAKNNKNPDIQALGSELEQKVNELKSLIDQEQGLKKTDPEKAFEILEGQMEELYQEVTNMKFAVQAAVEGSRGLNEFTKFTAKAKRDIARAERQKKDVTAAKDALANLENVLADAKQTLKESPEDFPEAIQTAGEARQQLLTALSELSGGRYEGFEFNSIKTNQKAIDIRIQDGFQKQSGGSSGSSPAQGGGGFGSPGF